MNRQLFTWDPFRDRLRGVKELWEERGIQPHQVCDWLCMVGDSADNIPGIKGIGQKGAAQLLAAHGDLDEIIAQRENFTPRRQAAIEDFMVQRELIDHLVTIREDVPLESGANGQFDFDSFVNHHMSRKKNCANGLPAGASQPRAFANASPALHPPRQLPSKM